MAADLDESDSGRVAEGVPATVTLFCGLPGSGKTTLARRLAHQGKGIRICTDEWQHELGVAHTDEDFHERLQRVLYRHALGLLRAGCDVILEDGLWRAEERTEKFRDARECGARIELHVFDVPIEELWTRLQDRNLLAAAGAAPVTRDDLERAWSVFEPPTAAELAMVDEWRRYGGASRL
jgi:predicted kinase